jgi:hypothetical protein
MLPTVILIQATDLLTNGIFLDSMFGTMQTIRSIGRLAQNLFDFSVKYVSWHPVETIIDSMCCVLSDKDLTASHLSRSNARTECREMPR